LTGEAVLADVNLKEVLKFTYFYWEIVRKAVTGQNEFSESPRDGTRDRPWNLLVDISRN